MDSVFCQNTYRPSSLAAVDLQAVRCPHFSGGELVDGMDGDVARSSKIHFLDSRVVPFAGSLLGRLTCKTYFLIPQTGLGILAWSEFNLDQPGNF